MHVMDLYYRLHVRKSATYNLNTLIVLVLMYANIRLGPYHKIIEENASQIMIIESAIK